MNRLSTCTNALLFFALGTLSALAQESKGVTLPAYHSKASINCFGCHQEEKPTKKLVSSESCMTCHGDYPAMKVTTKEAKPNPHASHLGEIPCAECHRQHRPPVVKCLECHTGKYTFNLR